ncbi:hypothetical protein B0T11DRAFT_18833 [Plectosphaerella cucumerina]|uniref:Uncharacterized protein n=1 Tax=Plectosphaerella cucumerina TaxID=40658 RepID=A0A8K0TTB9_9PEZI|nr:hypothetical protein B0T11DRAFT_18833 [Plectosphaerella cucumerina]
MIASSAVLKTAMCQRIRSWTCGTIHHQATAKPQSPMVQVSAKVQSPCADRSRTPVMGISTAERDSDGKGDRGNRASKVRGGWSVWTRGGVQLEGEGLCNWRWGANGAEESRSWGWGEGRGRSWTLLAGWPPEDRDPAAQSPSSHPASSTLWWPRWRMHGPCLASSLPRLVLCCGIVALEMITCGRVTVAAAAGPGAKSWPPSCTTRQREAGQSRLETGPQGATTWGCRAWVPPGRTQCGQKKGPLTLSVPGRPRTFPSVCGLRDAKW